jgi:hypothetical protein
MRYAIRLVIAPLATVIQLLAICSWITAQNSAPVHGAWVWNGTKVIGKPGGIESVRDFCQSHDIRDVYISVSSGGKMFGADFPRFISVLHQSNIQVEALLSSTDADEAGAAHDKLLDKVRSVVRFNRDHPKRSFDGIHLDIEPQQRPENKGPGNLRFLSGLTEAYRAVQQIAKPAGLRVNGDIQDKLLKADAAQRKALLSSLPWFTLMLYEVSKSNDGDSEQRKAEKIQHASQKFMAMAYDGLEGTDLATIVIGLRTPDYGELLQAMLKAVDQANSSNPHYAGWAWHSYNNSQ